VAIDLVKLKTDVSDAEALVVSSARKLSDGAVRDGRYSVIVNPPDLDDLREQLRRHDRATVSYLAALALTKEVGR
jgi:hypothetical protein